MSTSCYSLEPIRGHIPYLYLDKQTKKENGFALLSRDRLEGENFELRELGKLTVEQMGNIKQLLKQIDKHQIKENYDMNNHLASDTEVQSNVGAKTKKKNVKPKKFAKKAGVKK